MLDSIFMVKLSESESGKSGYIYIDFDLYFDFLLHKITTHYRDLISCS